MGRVVGRRPVAKLTDGRVGARLDSGGRALVGSLAECRMAVGALVVAAEGARLMPKASVNGIDLCYEVQGRGEPLALIVGLGGGRGGWFFQIRAFRKHYQVVTYDGRGMGRSSRANAPCTVRTMADDAVGLMDHLAIGRAHILGVSLGGMVAQEVAINYPQRVNKLVLASTTPGGGEVLDAHPELRAALGLVKNGPSQIDARTVNVGRLTGILNSLGFNGTFYRLVVARMATAYMKSVAAEGFVAQFEAALGHNALDRLYLIQAPTLVIAGAADRLVSPRSSEVLAGRIPGARLVMVAGGSHTLVAENRHRFNQEVLDFLK